MEPFLPFLIPVRGLRQQQYTYEYTVDGSFFRAFPDAPIADAQVAMTVKLDKRPDMFILDFDFSGTVRTECDRCLATIDLPVTGHNQLIVKLTLEESEEDADVVFVSPDFQKLQLAPYIYEYILLAMPIIRIYDCQEDAEPPCDMEMLDQLALRQHGQPNEAPDDSTPSVWDELKKLNIDSSEK